MKYTSLNSFLESQNCCHSSELKDCSVIVDAKSFFYECYKKSGYQYITGGEYNRYAAYVKSKLKYLSQCNVTCYFVFKSGMLADIERRKFIHQKILNKTNGTKNILKMEYFQPVLSNCVHVQVLDELNIKYFFSEYDSKETIITLARAFDCPVISNDIGFCLYNISCIKNIKFDESNKCTKCLYYDGETNRNCLRIPNSKLPILLALLYNKGMFLTNLVELLNYKRQNIIKPIMKWLNRRSKLEALDAILKKICDTEVEEFLNIYHKYRNINFKEKCIKNNWLVKMIANDMDKVKTSDKLWFAKALMFGYIPICYVNLYNKGIFSGSWVLYDSERKDAIFPALEIVAYAYGLLTGMNELTITLVCREFVNTKVFEIERHLPRNMLNKINVFTRNEPNQVCNTRKKNTFSNIFYDFILDVLPGFKYKLLETVPEDCWIIIIALVYYVIKVDKGFILEANCILLSYVMLGPVSDKIGEIKISNFSVTHNLGNNDNAGEANDVIKHADGVSALNKLINLFYVNDSANMLYDKTTLHQLAEYQHCLQHLNYLNKFCGGNVPCTVYHKSYNGTFIYNLYDHIKSKRQPIEELVGYLKESTTVLNMYMNIKNAFHSMLRTVEIMNKNV